MPSLFVYQVDSALSQSKGNFKEAWQMLDNDVKLSAQRRQLYSAARHPGIGGRGTGLICGRRIGAC